MGKYGVISGNGVFYCEAGDGSMINVLSLFDGISCGRMALEMAGIKIKKYYASEINKYAIKVVQHNYPDTVQLGDITKLKIKSLLLSEAYSYITEKYNYGIHSLQSIISEQEMLHRLDEEQTFSAYFGTQIQNENPKTSTNPILQINDQIWFFKNPMDNNKGLYDVIRSGNRGKVANKIDVGELCEHSFWWNGNRQQKSRIKETSIKGIIGTSSKRRDQTIIEKSCNQTIRKPSSERNPKTESIRAISRSNEKKKLHEGQAKSGLESKWNKKITNRQKKEGYNDSEITNKLYSKNEINTIEQDNRDFIRVHQKTQITMVECEWGLLIFKGVFNLNQGGSPCTGFSFAGKGLNFKDPQSKLFFEYVRILNEVRQINPDVIFLLENVYMKKEHEIVISKCMGVSPVKINSALVSAQNRKRNYWTNINLKHQGLFNEPYADIPQPKDCKIYLKDILEDEVDEKYYLSEAMIKRLMRKNDLSKDIPCKAKCLTAGGHSGGLHSDMDLIKVASLYENDSQGGRVYSINGKSATINSMSGGLGAKTGLYEVPIQINGSKESGGKQPYQQNRIYDENGKAPACQAQLTTGSYAVAMHGRGDNNEQTLEENLTGKTNSLITVQKDNLVKVHNTMPRSSKTGKGGTGPLSREDGKTYCLDTGNTNVVEINYHIRRLTPKEYCRLQDVPDNYFHDKDGKQLISDTQIYMSLGNGWQVRTVAHILSFIKL